MTDWTDDERRRFNEYRRAGKEHVESGAVRIRVGEFYLPLDLLRKLDV